MASIPKLAKQNTKAEKAEVNPMINPTLEEIQSLRDFYTSVTPQQKDKILDRSMIRNKENNTLLKVPLLCNINEMDKFGEGIYFYFFFTKHFMTIFGVLSLISIATIVFYGVTSGWNSSSSSSILISVSMANSPYINFTRDNWERIANKTAPAEIANKYDKSIIYLYIQQLLIMLSNLTMLIGYLVFKYRMLKVGKDIRRKNINASQYAVELRDLPSDISVQEVREYMKQFGEVIKVDFGRRFNGTLMLLVKLAQLRFKAFEVKHKRLVFKDRRKLQRIIKKINKISEEVSQKFKLHNITISEIENLSKINSFVIFNNVDSVTKMKNAFLEDEKRTFRQFICCEKPPKNENLKIRGKKPLIYTPDLPENINWENLEYPLYQKRLKLFGVAMISTLLITISVFLTLLLTCLDEVSFDYTCETVLSYAQVLANPTNENVYCYCDSLGISSIFSSDESVSICSGYYTDMIKTFSISTAISIVIVAVNKISEFIIFKLVEYIKFQSKTAILTTKVTFTLISDIINSLFVICIVYGRISGFSTVDFFNNIFQMHLNITMTFSSFSRKWFFLPGSKLTVSGFIFIAAGPVFSFFIYLALYIYNRYKLNRAKTVHEAKKAIPRAFDFERIKDYLLIIYLAMVFGGGIPLLFIIGFIYFILGYWSDKIIVLRFSRRPQAYSFEYIDAVCNTIPVAIILHIAFSLYMIGSWDLYTTVDQGLLRNPSNRLDIMIWNSISKSIVLSIYGLIVFSIIVGEIFFHNIFKRFFNRRNQKVSNRIGTYRENYALIKYFGIPNYNFLLNKKYHELLKTEIVNNISLDEFLKSPNPNVKDSIAKLKNQTSVVDIEVQPQGIVDPLVKDSLAAIKAAQESSRPKISSNVVYSNQVQQETKIQPNYLLEQDEIEMKVEKEAQLIVEEDENGKIKVMDKEGGEVLLLILDEDEDEQHKSMIQDVYDKYISENANYTKNVEIEVNQQNSANLLNSKIDSKKSPSREILNDQKKPGSIAEHNPEVLEQNLEKESLISHDQNLSKEISAQQKNEDNVDSAKVNSHASAASLEQHVSTDVNGKNNSSL